MFKVKETLLLENELTIIEALQAEIHAKGINKLNSVKKSHDNIMVSCPNPAHKGGAERKPSCGILTVDKGKDKAGTAHCFACGYVASLEEFVSNCFGLEDAGVYGRNWLLKKFSLGDSAVRAPIELNLSRVKPTATYVTEEELDKYRYVHPYMYKRKLTDEIIEKFDVGYDENTLCLTFPVWDAKGNCVFVARRSVKTKFFNYPRDVFKPIYALNFLGMKDRSVIVCESIINALTCWCYGVPAIALIGTGNYEQYKILKACGVRKFVLALDGDEAGYKARARFRRYVTGKMVTDLVIPDGQDINDFEEEDFKKLKEVPQLNYEEILKRFQD